MEDGLKEKYDRLLGNVEGPNHVGEMTEKELLLGRTLKRMREYRQISLEDLSEGICAPSDMAAMENGIKASLLMTAAYLTRMGKSVNKFEFYSTNSEYGQQCKREQIIEVWKRGDLEAAKLSLAEYEKHFQSKFSRRWSIWQKRCIALRGGILPEEHIAVWDGLVHQKLYFTQEELDYLWELAGFYGRRDDTGKVREVYALMYRNTMATGMFLPQNCRGMDEERKLEILPGLCMAYGHFEHLQGQEGEALQILDTAVELLRKNMRMELLKELLAERMEIYKGLWEGTGSPEMYKRMGTDAQDLVALLLVYGDREAVREKMAWLKEVKWESTILDSLSTVLAKQSD